MSNILSGRKIYIIALALALVMGCASLERNSYVAIGTITTGVELARQAYIDHANTCACVTEAEFANVRSLYEKYQLAARAVQTAVTVYKTSGDQNQLKLAINAATASAADLIRLVTSLLPPGDTARLKPKLPKEIL